MTMFNAANTNPAVLVQQVQVALIQIREAMTAAQYLRDFSAAISLTDLTNAPPDGVGMDPAAAQAVLSACADAWGHAQLYQTGTDPRNPPANYNYGASQKLVIGPRPRLGRKP